MLHIPNRCTVIAAAAAAATVVATHIAVTGVDHVIWFLCSSTTYVSKSDLTFKRNELTRQK